MARELGCNPKTINPVLERLGLKYEGNQSGKGFSKSNKEMSLLEYLEKHPECKVLDAEFDLFCDQVIAAEEKAIASLLK